MKPDDYDDFDREIAARLREIAPPSDLRRRILSVEPRRSRSLPWALLFGVAAAAVLILALLLRPQIPSPDAARSDLAAFLSSDFPLDVTDKPLPVLSDWLAQRGVARGARFPLALARMIPKGCREITWQGRRGALICFDGGSAGVIHLVVLDAAGFSPLAEGVRMPFRQIADWNSTGWQKDGLIYFVFAKTTDSKIEEILPPV